MKLFPNQAILFSNWTERPERGSLFMLRLITWVSLRLGRRVGRFALYLVAGYFLLLAPDARRASRAYLSRVFGRSPRIWHIYHHFFIFAATVHDRIYLLNNRFDHFDIHVKSSWEMDAEISAGRGVLLVGAHLGNFEVLRVLGQQRLASKVVMVMYEKNSRRINAMLSAINPQSRENIISLGAVDSMLLVQEQLEDGAIVGLLADRSVAKEQFHSLKFLGKVAHLPSGTFRMAALLRKPVFFMSSLYIGPGKYEVFFELLSDFTMVEKNDRDQVVSQAMEKYISLLERYCHKAPYNWFNFFDFWQNDQGES